jgi:hypothetical protein
MSEELEICAAPECDEEFLKSVHNQIYCNPQCKRDAENIRRRRDLAKDVAAALAPSYGIENDDEHEDQLTFLRKENRRLHNLYMKHKHNSQEQVDAIYSAAYDALSTMEIAPVRPPKIARSSNTEEVANPVVADWQIGKKTASYNSDVCAERIDLFGEKIQKITEIQRSDHPVRRANVYALGDMVEGEDIFPGQTFEIDASLYRQVVSGVEILSDFLRRMLSTFETVHFAGVIGNHGLLSSRNRGNYNPETNMDRLLYKFVSMLFADEPRISFNIPDGPGESNFYTVDYIGQYGTLLMHGDQLGQPTSAHSYYKKVLGWKDTGVPERFDDVFIGHWHQNTKLTLGTTVLRIAGTPESDNTYAQERLGVMGRPSQHLQFVHPEKGVTCEYDIYLDV